MLTDSQIQFLNDVCLDKWTEENGIINVEGNVDMSEMNLTQIPVQFGKVTGYFDCQDNKLTTLEGAPSIVHGRFDCDKNKLSTLKGGPIDVDNFYSCSRNRLTNLIGAPEICNGTFWCISNKLTSLEGCPRIIKYHLYCEKNTYLNLWSIGRVEGHVYYDVPNELNEWIITCAQKDIIFPHFTLEENVNWIKREQKYSCLLDAPLEIREYFSPRILHLADMGSYNESKILDYKKFSSLC